MHGKLVHVETSPLHLLKLEWQGDTRSETKVNCCTTSTAVQKSTTVQK